MPHDARLLINAPFYSLAPPAKNCCAVLIIPKVEAKVFLPLRSASAPERPPAEWSRHRRLRRLEFAAKARVADPSARATRPWRCQSTRGAESGPAPRVQTGASPPRPQLYLPGCEGYDPVPPDRSRIVYGAVLLIAAADTP